MLSFVAIELYDVVSDGRYGLAKEILESLEEPQDAVNRYYRGPNTLLGK